ncbi:MAG: hypothetical protein IRY99_19895 [Isosphaeraceae bacterium]|nr:hypothetical protein [Isosphaeraceae bacterium]
MMTIKMYAYCGFIFTIECDAEGPAYIVDFPDLPDIITSGSTLPEARLRLAVEPVGGR